MKKSERRVGRRRALKGLGAIALAGPALGAVACGADTPAATSDAPAPSGSGTCTLYPSQTEGPFYVDLDLLRRDITDGKPGTRLRLALRVVRAGSCEPIRDAVVDVWHADAHGLYSAFAGQGDTRDVDARAESFLRGIQVTDADGRVEFRSIYPGWYRGRTTHIHVKVQLGSRTAVTSQMYFPDDVNAAVYRTGAYAPRGQKDTSNAADGIGRTGGDAVMMAVAADGDGYLASLTIAVAG